MSVSLDGLWCYALPSSHRKVESKSIVNMVSFTIKTSYGQQFSFVRMVFIPGRSDDTAVVDHCQHLFSQLWREGRKIEWLQQRVTGVLKRRGWQHMRLSRQQAGAGPEDLQSSLGAQLVLKIYNNNNNCKKSKEKLQIHG